MVGHPQQTPLYAIHLALGARMGEFAGWSMPLWYRSAIGEHCAVRNSAGLFDTSHLSKFEISGDKALDFLQRICTSDIAQIEVGGARYTLLCREDGGILEDAIVYRLADRFMLVGNAINAVKDWLWLRDHLIPGVTLTDVTRDMAILALQGPHSVRVLESLVGRSVAGLPRFHSLAATVARVRALIARGGYTGEDGFELFCLPADAPALWHALMGSQRSDAPVACGLAARDTLRLEAGLRLYGQDIDENDNPLEAGLGWAVGANKPDFIGKEAILRAGSVGIKRKLVGMVTRKRGGVPRSGNLLLFDGNPVGRVTSGAFSPCLGRDVAMGYLPISLAAAGVEVEIVIRGRAVGAQVVRLPFYRPSI